MTIRNLIIFITIATFAAGYYALQMNQPVSSNKIYRVAVFAPASHPAMDEITDGFITTLKKDKTLLYKFDQYNANGNKTLLRSQAEEIIHQNYDLVMSIGADASRILHELTHKKKLTTPIIFTAVSDPVGLGIITSAKYSGNNLTGVEDLPDYEDQLSRLLQIKPSTKKILLVYDPVTKTGMHDICAQNIKKITDHMGIELFFAQVFHSNEIQAKIQPLLTHTDVVMILTDHTVVSGIDSLITLCNRYNVTLYASDLNSGIKGAALSYGVTEYDFGIDAGHLALQVLVEHKQPNDLPIINPRSKKLIINHSTIQKQGITLSPKQIEELEKKGIING
jgi:putative ABC transport system substrate-binding protein